MGAAVSLRFCGKVGWLPVEQILGVGKVMIKNANALQLQYTSPPVGCTERKDLRFAPQLLVVTGHSLGGGVATLLASTGSFDKAIVFNPAGVNDSTFSAVKGDKDLAAKKTTVYYSRSDALTMIQDLFRFIVPNAIGNRVLVDGAGLHPISPVVKVLQE